MKRALLLAPMALAALLATPGCVSLQRDLPARSSYLLDVRHPSAKPAPPAAPALQVRRLRVVAPFEGKPFVTRYAGGRAASDATQEWFVAPAAFLTEETQDWLSASGLFSAVVPASSAVAAGYALEGTFTALHSDAAQTPTRARLAAQFHLLQLGKEERRVASWEFAAEQPLAGDDAAAVVAAQERNLAEVLGKLEAELATATAGR